jgi:hypothetical protein
MKRWFCSILAFALIFGLALVFLGKTQAATYWQKKTVRVTGTAGATLAEGDVVYFAAAGTVLKADADGIRTIPADGIIGKGGASGVSVEVVTQGVLGGQSSLTVGGAVYLSTTAGGFTQSEPLGYSQEIGYAISATQIVVDFNAESNNATSMISAPMWEFIDEFNTDTLQGDWTITTTEAGAGSATEATGDTNLGALLITNAAGDDDLDSLQLDNEVCQLTSNKQTSYSTKFTLNEATENDLVLGLVITDTTVITNTDGVYFFKDDGITSWYFGCTKDSTVTSAWVDIADTSAHTFSFLCNGQASCTPYIDGVAGTAISTNLPDNEILTPTIFLMNGEAAAKTILIDYVAVKQER